MPGGSTNFKTRGCQQTEGAWLSRIREEGERWGKQAETSKQSPLNPKGKPLGTGNFSQGKAHPLSPFRQRLHSLSCSPSWFIWKLQVGGLDHQIPAKSLESLLIFSPLLRSLSTSWGPPRVPLLYSSMVSFLLGCLSFSSFSQQV